MMKKATLSGWLFDFMGQTCMEKNIQAEHLQHQHGVAISPKMVFLLNG